MKTQVLRRTIIALAWLVSRATYADDTKQFSEKLDEVIVTAQKRTENIQKVPVSAQVIGSETLVEQNHNSLAELTETVPGVHAGNNAITNDLFIRGVGSGGNSSFDQSVATFVDDIYHGRSRQSGSTFLDLDRIEILKGPQSTFFGNNAIAGALNIVTKKPSDTFDASGRLLYGQFGQYAAEGAIGSPIAGTFGARLAVTRNGESGWIGNVNTGRHAPDVDNEAARLTLTYNPTDSLDTKLKIEGSRSRTAGTLGGLPSQWTNCPPAAPLTPGFGGSCAQARALGAAVPMGLDNNLNTGLPGQYQQISTVEDVLTVAYRKWGQTFTSVSGFSGYHFNNSWDQSQLPVELITSQIPEKYHQFSQEFRIASPSGGAIEYQVGVYFQTDRLDFLADTNLPELNGLASVLRIPQPIAVLNGFSQNERVYSIFGSLSWTVTDRLKFNAGVRGSRDKKDAIGIVDYGTGTQVYGGFVPLPLPLKPDLAFFFGPANNTQQLSRSDQAWMPSAGIQYQLIPEAMAYFTYNRGFKAGGVNGENGLNQPGTPNIYSPEFVNAYELGLKSKWFDDKVLLNLDVFRSDYQDLQVNTLIFNAVLNGNLDAVGNAAASRSQGVELEAQWLVAKDFKLGANVAYLDSSYVSYRGAPPSTLDHFHGLPFSDLSGQPTPYAPRWSGSVSASYSLLLAGDHRLTTQINPYFTSSYYTSSGDSFFLVNSYVRLDGRLTLEKPDSHWALDLIGKNLTNRVIVVVPGLYIRSKEEPRNVAVQFRYQF